MMKKEKQRNWGRSNLKNKDFQKTMIKMLSNSLKSLSRKMGFLQKKKKRKRFYH